MGEQHAIQFSGHVGIEIDDHAALHTGPFAVRSRQYGENPRFVGCDGTGDLCFLTAHDIRRSKAIARDETGHDREVGLANGGDSADERIERRRTCDIWRFDPALPTADHSARQSWRTVRGPFTEERLERLIVAS